MGYLNTVILPTLDHLRVGTVTRDNVTSFFYEYRRRKRGSNHSYDILRNMFDCVIAWGHQSEVVRHWCKGLVRISTRLTSGSAGVTEQPRRFGIRGMGLPTRTITNC